MSTIGQQQGTPPRLGTRLIEAGRNQAVVTTLVSAGLFIVQVGIGRRFGQAGLGEYTVTTLAIYLTTVGAMIAVPLTIGRHVAYSHEQGRDKDDPSADVGLTIVLVLSLAGAALLALGWNAFGPSTGSHPVPPQAVAVALIGSCLVAYSSQLLQARLLIPAAGLVLLAQPFAIVVALGIDTFVRAIGPGQLAVVGAVAGGIAGGIALVVLGVRPRPDARRAIALLREAVHMAPLAYVNVLSTWVDKLVVAVVLGPAGLGVYQAASTLVEGSIRLLRSAGPFLLSAFGRAVARGADHPLLLRLLLVRSWSAYAAVAAAALIAGASGVVSWLYGPGFAGAGVPLQLLAAALVPTVISITLLTAGAGLEHRNALTIARAAIPLQILVGAAFTVAAGPTGMAAAQLGVIALVAIAQLHWSRDPDLALPARTGSRVVALAIAAAAIGFGLQFIPLPWPLRSALAGAVCTFFALMLVVGRQEQAVARRLMAFWT